jgi:cytochrome c
MSDLTFNKIAGAVLATGLAMIGLGQLSAGIYGSEAPKKPGYLVEVVEESGGAAAVADTPPDWGTVLPTADVAAGQAVFAKCSSCHSIVQGGPNGTGPDIWGVVGRKPGSHGGFAYSTGMTEFGGKQAVWDYDHIYEFLKGPQKYISGTKMSFVGLKKQEDRINVIAYLRSQGGTLPVPAPDPARAPAAAAPAAGAAPAAEGAATPAAGAVPAAAAATAPAVAPAAK